MGTKAQNQVRKQVGNKGIAHTIIFALISILIIGAPLFQGLFFQREIMISNIFAFAILIVFLLNKKRNKEKLTIFNSPYDCIGLLFIIAYLLPIVFFQWASLRDAIDILIRYTTYYAIYLMVKDMAQFERYKEHFIKVLILASLVVAFIGIFGATGYIKLEDVIMGNRISSTFQYPNTLAALMMAMFFLVNGSIHKAEKYIEKLIYGTAGFVMLFTFIFTYSRAAWLLFPIFALLYLIFLSGKDRIASILYFVATLLPNILVLQPFTSQLAIDAETKPKALIVFFIGIGIFKVLYSIVLFVQSRLADKHYKLIYGFLGAVIIGVSILGYTALNTTVPLVFDNMAATENKTNQIQRTVKEIEGNKDYILKLNVEAIASEVEAQWPWRVRINSVNEAGEQELLIETLGDKDVNGEIEVPFTTLETTQNISIYFTNIYPKTKVVFNEVKVIDGEENVVENIKLKYKYIPESLIARLNSIDLSEDSSATRLTYYRDSFSIFKSKPIFGGGGGTWKALYPKYQSLPYNSTEAHNYFLQALVETGITGIAVLVLLIFTFVVHLLKAWKRKDTLTISILFSILALLGHSGLDFNFSFHSIPIILWTLIALLETKTFEDIKPRINKIDLSGKSVGTVVPIILAVPLLLFSISLYSAYAISVDNGKSINEIPIEESISKMEKAVLLDPFHSNMRIDLAKMQRTYGFETDNFSLVEKAENHLKKAVKHSPYMPVALQETASHYISLGRFEDAFKYLDKSTETTPLKPNSYETKSEAYLAVANYYLGKGEVEKAIDIYTNNMIGIIDEMRVANEKTEKPVQLTQNTLQNIFRAKYFVDNYNNPEKLEQLNDIVYMSYLDLEGATAVGMPWRVSDSSSGDIKYEIKKEGLKISNTGENNGFIYSQFFSLNPDTMYEVEVVFSQESTQKNLRSHIISMVGRRTQVSEDINLEEIEDGLYYYNFNTTEDLEPGRQYIRFDHPGNSEDYFVIRQVIIKKIE